MELTVKKINGEDTGRKVSLIDSVFGIEPNDHAIYLDVKQIMNNKRQGTHDSRERSDVTGSTRKLKRQKGTGTARSGDIKSPVFRGGGRVFGPHPRDYNMKLNKKLKKLARLSALTYKAIDNEIMIIEDFKFDSIKTKNFQKILNDLQVENQKTLLVVSEADRNLYFSARNIPSSKVLRVETINTYDILNSNKIVFMEGALKNTEELFSKK
ncbi:MAG: 50S ribosomal protein L4 [Bacteroidales bacterium]|nr:50S ribosomal protein L4 [Bacteroidales bacterium]